MRPWLLPSICRLRSTRGRFCRRDLWYRCTRKNRMRDKEKLMPGCVSCRSLASQPAPAFGRILFLKKLLQVLCDDVQRFQNLGIDRRLFFLGFQDGRKISSSFEHRVFLGQLDDLSVDGFGLGVDFLPVVLVFEIGGLEMA